MIAERLAYSGAILVEGPKWCGKTTTCEQHAKSIAYISDPDMREYYLDMARMRMQKLLEGEQPRLFDEWQEIPELWDAIRFSIDHSEEDAHFLLTGSAVFRLVSEGVRSLNTYWKLLEGKKIRKPVFRMILTAVGDYAYTRKEDGIIVCPISALKP